MPVGALAWDLVGKHYYETGVDHGVLYIPNVSGVYNDGVAWNGLVSVTESPGGAEPSPQFADNIKYLNLVSAEDFSATLEAFTYPDEFNQFDGVNAPLPGLYFGQQPRKTFGLCYRTKLGNDVGGDGFAFKLHLVYGCVASPSEKAYNTVNDSPEAVTFSWSISSTPTTAGGTLLPVSLITIDSNVVNPAKLTTLMTTLYGAVATAPALPTPAAIITALT